MEEIEGSRKQAGVSEMIRNLGDALFAVAEEEDLLNRPDAVFLEDGECECKNTQCLDDTCSCFEARKYCSTKCTCQECRNNIVPKSERKKESPVIINEAPSASVPPKRKKKRILCCRCFTTNCSSIMCSCFKADRACSNICKCDKCANTFGRRQK
ncbi:hypothetical protein ABFS83_01G030400 [Erythranthe nasuta]